MLTVPVTVPRCINALIKHKGCSDLLIVVFISTSGSGIKYVIAFNTHIIAMLNDNICFDVVTPCLIVEMMRMIKKQNVMKA
jgi:hypothetical protein